MTLCFDEVDVRKELGGRAEESLNVFGTSSTVNTFAEIKLSQRLPANGKDDRKTPAR